MLITVKLYLSSRLQNYLVIKKLLKKKKKAAAATKGRGKISYICI